MCVVQIVEADDNATIAHASALLRLAGFERAADDLKADGINPEHEVVLIALGDDRRPLGVVAGRQPFRVIDDDEVERSNALLTYVAVDPAQRRRRIGSALVSAFCDRSRERGADYVVLQIGNPTAEHAATLARFYLANDFALAEHGFRRKLVG